VNYTTVKPGRTPEKEGLHKTGQTTDGERARMDIMSAYHRLRSSLELHPSRFVGQFDPALG